MTIPKRREWLETLDKLYNPSSGLYQTGMIRLTGAIKDLFYYSAHFPDVQLPILLAEHFREKADAFAWYTSQGGLIYEYSNIDVLQSDSSLDEAEVSGNKVLAPRDPLAVFKEGKNARVKQEGRRGGGEYAGNPVDAFSKVNELLMGRKDKRIVVLFHDIWWEFPKNSPDGSRIWPLVRNWPNECLGQHLVILASDRPVAWTDDFGVSKITDLAVLGPTPDEIKQRMIYEYLVKGEEFFDWQILERLTDYFSQSHQPPHKDYHAFVTQMLRQRQGRYYGVSFLDQVPSGVNYRKIDVAGFKQYLQKHIIGQESAKQWAITEVERLQKRGVSAKRPKPIPIIRKLFAGPSGVGKTEIAKIIARYVFQREAKVIAGTEYQLDHEIAKLLGAPPGYVGHGTPGELTNFIKENPFGLIILDEFEKASESLRLFFMNALDQGIVTTPDGFRLEFGNTIVIATSNTGSKEIDEQPGNENIHPETRAQLYKQAIGHFYNQALLGRFSGFLIFDRLNNNERRQIAQFHFFEFIKRSQADIEGAESFQVSASNKFYEMLLEKCPVTMGARIIPDKVDTVMNCVLDYFMDEHPVDIILLDWFAEHPTVNGKEMNIGL